MPSCSCKFSTYLLTAAPHILGRCRYGMEYHGQMALLISLLVAFTQVIPEHQVQILGFIKARVKVKKKRPLPVGLTLSVEASYGVLDFFDHNDITRLPKPIYSHSVWLVCVMDIPPLLQAQCWRLHRRGSVIRRSERNICFDKLVPTISPVSISFHFLHCRYRLFLSTPLSMLGNTVYKLGTRLHLLPTSVPHDIESGGYSQVPGGARAEAERRRSVISFLWPINRINSCFKGTCTEGT
jgi:hypothetical protein